MKKNALAVGLGLVSGNIFIWLGGLMIYLSTSLIVPHHWQVSYNLGRYDKQNSFIERTQVALMGLGALVAEEALYYTIFRDEKGQMFDGNNRYQIHFDAQQLPKVHAFWSLTMYNKSSFLIENPIQRFAIGDRSPQLQYNQDGSLDIYISSIQPANSNNWLPAPNGEFSLTLRAYLPSEDLLLGDWLPPAVINIKSS